MKEDKTDLVDVKCIGPGWFDRGEEVPKGEVRPVPRCAVVGLVKSNRGEPIGGKGTPKEEKQGSVIIADD